MSIGESKHWSEKKAAWYSQALRYSTYPRRAVEVIAARLQGINSLLDVGAGTGSLALPLARQVRKVTALEPSQPMLEILEKKASRLGIKNVKAINASWGEVTMEPHDAILVASVPAILDDIPGFLKEASGLVRKKYFLIQGAGGERHKFFFDELYPLLFDRPFRKRGNYLATLAVLQSQGILADVNVFSHRFDQRFKDLAEAVDFFKEHLGIKHVRYDFRLAEFLKDRLEAIPGGLLHKIRKSSVLISWKV